MVVRVSGWAKSVTGSAGVIESVVQGLLVVYWMPREIYQINLVSLTVRRLYDRVFLFCWFTIHLFFDSGVVIHWQEIVFRVLAFA